MTTPTDDPNAISYKVGFPEDTPEEEAQGIAESALRDYGKELGREPIIETFEKVQTDTHKEAGEYLMVVRGRWRE